MQPYRIPWFLGEKEKLKVSFWDNWNPSVVCFILLCSFLSAVRSQRAQEANSATNGWLDPASAASSRMITAQAGRARRRSSLAAANMAANLLLSPTPPSFSPKLAHLAENEDLEEEDNISANDQDGSFHHNRGRGDGAVSREQYSPPPDNDDQSDYNVTPARRRAVTTSDLRSCALVQTRMKTWKNYPE